MRPEAKKKQNKTLSGRIFFFLKESRWEKTVQEKLTTIGGVSPYETQRKDWLDDIGLMA